jgi:hypothetical protein
MADQFSGYYTYGLGANQTVHYADDDWPPGMWRYDPVAEEWVPTGSSFTILDRAADGDAEGPFSSPPDGVPAVTKG